MSSYEILKRFEEYLRTQEVIWPLMRRVGRWLRFWLVVWFIGAALMIAAGMFFAGDSDRGSPEQPPLGGFTHE